jgi:hypothetical protein
MEEHHIHDLDIFLHILILGTTVPFIIWAAVVSLEEKQLPRATSSCQLSSEHKSPLYRLLH